ncbi:MAG TPA: AAA family ATPase [Steroidobacteraceae bacterium]|jgi:type II secretory pathway predicted ATPase ExeA|nr:AAA family ATPase [Steroidobacteraceae bacterium]
MYLELFKLRELPFRLSPDPQFLYLSKQHARAKAYMESTIWFTDGFVVITGEIGSGKTTLIESFLQEVQRDVVVAQIGQTQVSVVAFLQAVLVQFGFAPFKMKKAELIATLNNFLVEQYAAGRKVLLIVDEAQNLSLKVLEEIRMLSGVETTKEKVLRIIVAGQPELNQKLDAPELVQLAQRIRLRFHLDTLSATEMNAYMHHRLEVAGAGDRQIFAADTYPEIFRYTGGVPRLVNTLCDTAMLAAFGHDRDHVLLEDINTSIQELGWHEPQMRPSEPGHVTPATNAERTANFTDGQRANHHARHGDSRDELTDTANDGVAAGPAGRVIVVTEGRTIQELPLNVGRIIIGRTSDNDIQIDSRFVSRHHCQITTGTQGSVIEDLNSTNGIFVQGKRVRRYNLNDGDIVVIGKHELMYVDERLARARVHSSEDAAGVPVLAKPADEQVHTQTAVDATEQAAKR